MDTNNCYCDFGKYKISEKVVNLRKHIEKKNDKKGLQQVHVYKINTQI